jgi:hypothetical protein
MYGSHHYPLFLGQSDGCRVTLKAIKPSSLCYLSSESLGM